MSALSSNAHWITFMNAIPFAVLGTSLLGSSHCAAMCGGLVITVARDPKGIFLYHLGRLIGYCSLGAIAGFLGQTAFQFQAYAPVSWFSTIVLAFGFVFLGFRLWFGKSLHLFILPHSVWRKLVGMGPATTGLLSVFLPCGWLHTFVLGAIATRSIYLGVLYLFLFWLGTMPVMSFGPLAVSKILLPISTRAPRLSAIILIAIGIGSLGAKFLPMHSSSHSPLHSVLGDHCHSSAEHSSESE